jgi:hypothetical protein
VTAKRRAVAIAVLSAEAAIAARAGGGRETGTPAWAGSRQAQLALIALVAFILYWGSALVLQGRGGTTHFGADAHLYSALFDGSTNDRITRFHPLTAGMVAVWVKVLAPLTPWITQQNLLKALFAAVGALGVWVAMWAFAAAVPRRYVMLLGMVYATSLGVWYFSSIEESKIVSTTLAALYIATYLNLRTSWTVRGAVLLTAVLLVACLNEVIAGFLVIIPAVDTLIQRGWDWRAGRWIFLHALAAPVALLFLEGVVKPLTTGDDPEGASHLSMLIYYVSRNDYGLDTIYAYLVKWLFFNIAAPSIDALEYPGLPETYAGDFDASLANYFGSPLSVALVALFGLVLAAAVWPRGREEGAPALPLGLLAGLAAFALVRGVFFLIFNPSECMLFSSGTTLTHMLLIGIPFAASRFPAKGGILAASAALLLIINGSFMIGR